MNGVTAFPILCLMICLLLSKETLIHTFSGNVGCLYAKAVDISSLEPCVEFRSTSKHWTAIVPFKKMMRSLLSWRKPKARASSRAAGKTTQRFFVLWNLQS